jgi:CO dehydrogenase maturation factor
MKIMVCGKGGSGKSTVSVMLARGLARQGFRVLIIDADESNLGLHRLLGAPAPQVILDSLGGKKGMRERRKDPLTGNRQDLFRQDMAWSDLGENCVSEKDGVSLASVGKIHEPGEGCACPMGMLSREIFTRLHMGERDVVIVDTAAGIEHFGRDFGFHTDMIIGVLDPSFESILLCEKISAMAAAKDYRAYFILNRANPEMEALIREKAKALNLVSVISMNEDIFKAGLEGRAVEVTDPGIEAVCDLIIHHKEGS